MPTLMSVLPRTKNVFARTDVSIRLAQCVANVLALPHIEPILYQSWGVCSSPITNISSLCLTDTETRAPIKSGRPTRTT